MQNLYVEDGLSLSQLIAMHGVKGTDEFLSKFTGYKWYDITTMSWRYSKYMPLMWDGAAKYYKKGELVEKHTMDGGQIWSKYAPKPEDKMTEPDEEANAHYDNDNAGKSYTFEELVAPWKKAEEEGFLIITAAPNQVLLDLDAKNELEANLKLAYVQDSMESIGGKLGLYNKPYNFFIQNKWKSKGGIGWHVVIESDKEIEPATKIQAALMFGSDPKREEHHKKFLENGVTNPFCLFKPTIYTNVVAHDIHIGKVKAGSIKTVPIKDESVFIGDTGWVSELSQKDIDKVISEAAEALAKSAAKKVHSWAWEMSKSPGEVPKIKPKYTPPSTPVKVLSEEELSNMDDLSLDQFLGRVAS